MYSSAGNIGRSNTCELRDVETLLGVAWHAAADIDLLAGQLECIYYIGSEVLNSIRVGVIGGIYFEHGLALH